MRPAAGNQVEEANHSLGLLEWLDQAVPQDAIQASITESDVILVMFVRGVHGDLQSGEIPGRLLLGSLGRKNPPPGAFTIWGSGVKPMSSCWAFIASTESFPEREKYGLAHQMRRAPLSIPANIAEGFGKRSHAEKARFLNIAEGSLEECRCYLTPAEDLGYGQTELLMARLEEASRMLNAYARAILASGS
jgi:four helix bundle protein